MFLGSCPEEGHSDRHGAVPFEDDLTLGREPAFEGMLRDSTRKLKSSPPMICKTHLRR